MAASMDGERTPLLINNPSGSRIQQEDSPATAQGKEEKPEPQYTTLPDGSTAIICTICWVKINITGKARQHVVQCPNCNEASPLNPAPAGKRYIRCPCKCLLVCKLSSTKIKCPRSDCKRVLSIPPPIKPGDKDAARIQVICVYCSDQFVVTLRKSYTVCPHCQKSSPLGPGENRRKSLIFGVIGFALLLLGILLSVLGYAVNPAVINPGQGLGAGLGLSFAIGSIFILISIHKRCCAKYSEYTKFD